MADGANVRHERATRLVDLFSRIEALPEAGVASIATYLDRVEAMHGVRQPEPSTQVVVGGATITARPDLVYQGEVEVGKASRQ